MSVEWRNGPRLEYRQHKRAAPMPLPWPEPRVAELFPERDQAEPPNGQAASCALRGHPPLPLTALGGSYSDWLAPRLVRLRHPTERFAISGVLALALSGG